MRSTWTQREKHCIRHVAVRQGKQQKDRRRGSEGDEGRWSLVRKSDLSCSTKASWDRNGLTKGQTESQRKASRRTAVKQSLRDKQAGNEQRERKDQQTEHQSGRGPRGFMIHVHGAQRRSRWKTFIPKLSGAKSCKCTRTAALVTAHAVFSCLAGIKTWVMCFRSILCCSKTKKPRPNTHTGSGCSLCVLGT